MSTRRVVPEGAHLGADAAPPAPRSFGRSPRIDVSVEGVRFGGTWGKHIPWSEIAAALPLYPMDPQLPLAVLLVHHDGTGTVLAAGRLSTSILEAIRAHVPHRALPHMEPVGSSAPIAPLLIIRDRIADFRKIGLLLVLWNWAAVAVAANPQQFPVTTSTAVASHAAGSLVLLAFFVRALRRQPVTLRADEAVLTRSTGRSTTVLPMPGAEFVHITQVLSRPTVARYSSSFAMVVHGVAHQCGVPYFNHSQREAWRLRRQHLDLHASIVNRLRLLAASPTRYPQAQRCTTLDVVGDARDAHPKLTRFACAVAAALLAASTAAAVSALVNLPREAREVMDRSVLTNGRVTHVGEMDGDERVLRVQPLEHTTQPLMVTVEVEDGESHDVGQRIAVRFDPEDTAVAWESGAHYPTVKLRTTQLHTAIALFGGGAAVALGTKALWRLVEAPRPGTQHFTPDVPPPSRRRWRRRSARRRRAPERMGEQTSPIS